MKSREQIITEMCYTWRHDYGLIKESDDPWISGMTLKEREYLWNQMAQVFDNAISPNMKIET